MRVKEGFILHNIGDEYMAVATGDTVKVFVWNALDGVSPLALAYSTTVAAPAE